MAPGLEISNLNTLKSNFSPPTILTKEPTATTTSIISTPESEPPTDITLVLHPSLITQDFDLLRFHSAAFDQLPKTNGSDIKDQPRYSTHLISSPYNNPSHYLDLTHLPTPSILFAKALSAIAPIIPTYATAPYASALNFDEVLAVLRSLVPPGNLFPETSFYVVVFQSKLKADIDQEWLYKLDYESHREACESGGLLKYWFGRADAERRNLATCFWHSRTDAYKGGLGPWHKKARAAGRELYERIVFSTWRFTVEEGGVGWKIEGWVE